MTYKLGSLFDGSGGFPLAGSLCGIEPVWASEVEPYPIAVTRSRFPNMKHLGDISKIHGGDIDPVDIITFGSPCQDLSVAGKRAGLKHEDKGDDETTRSGLFMEAVRIIKEMRDATNGQYPRFALWENVPGAFSSNKGWDFHTVLAELIRIKEPHAVMPTVPAGRWSYADIFSGSGWSLAYRVFDAQFWGVPQRRRRSHLVIDFGGQCAGEVLFKREGLRGYFAEGRTPWQGIACHAQDGSGANDQYGEYGADGGRGRQLDDVIPVTMKIRSGCDGGGHVYDGIDSTLRANAGDNQLSVAYSAGFCTEPSAKARGVGFQDEIAPTLRAGVTPACAYSIKNHPADSRVDIDESGKVQTLTSRMGTGGGNVPMVMEPVVYDGANVTSPINASNPLPGDPSHKLSTDGRNYCVIPVFCLQGNGIDRADTAGCNGKGWKEDTSYTLNTIDRPAVAYGTDVGLLNSTEEQSPALLARGYKDPHLVSYPADRVRYIVRRLTPTECARLQGFPDCWGHLEKKDAFTDADWYFWQNVRNTHAAINGKAEKSYTKAQMLTWYNKLHTDSAEYKMWGNGIALPPALYCMQGIVDALQEEADDAWLM